MCDTLYVWYILWMIHYANILINATFHPKVAILEFCWNSRKNAMNDRQVKILICFHPNFIFLFTLMPPLLGSFLFKITFYLTMVFSRSVLKWLKSCALRWGATDPGESTLSIFSDHFCSHRFLTTLLLSSSSFIILQFTHSSTMYQ